ncbi:hypothetical protein HVIM_03967 (plasmid) [Roseomonas mucosa]|nr:hypothetical protein HVIM_03967 [Roseomonas mucosa]
MSGQITPHQHDVAAVLLLQTGMLPSKAQVETISTQGIEPQD